MIPTKTRESRRVKAFKLPKNLERIYKAGKCRDCAVVVTRMDFAKILGKFTKVKIQYESSSTAKGRQNSQVVSPNSNTRLKSNENGMVLLHRNSYNQHPVKEVIAKKSKQYESPARSTPNILKENNRLKKTVKGKNSNYNDTKPVIDTHSIYGIVFEDPLGVKNNEANNKISLSDLLPHIDDSILPSMDWCIDYFPKSDEPKDDKVYDRIAAELENLMYNEKSKSDDKTDTESKVDDFPSIMDILNDNNSEVKPNSENNDLEFKSNLESSDVEAMLLGKCNPTSESLSSTPMAVDNTDMGTLLEDVNQLNAENKLPRAMENDDIENPQSPSILDEALQKGIEEHLPPETNLEIVKQEKTSSEKQCSMSPKPKKTDSDIKGFDTKGKIGLTSKTGITHVVFKKLIEGSCFKSVTCPKNLKYSIELNSKSVEFLGAPKFISNLEDLQVLLQIVNDSELDSLYVLQ